MSFTLRLSRRAVLIVPILLGAAVLFLTSCTEPSPLYGSWADNRGNIFIFFDDGAFNAKIAGADQVYEGNYSLLMNVLTLNCTNIELRIVTEWDIRGNILYLDWTTAENESMSLSLYKISN